jgi:very-short-patch-repair endonuclease
MGKIFNQQSQFEKRRLLRNNMTKAESLLWAEIRNKKVEGAKFRRQSSIGSYVVDFYCPKLKLAIEVDGVTHNTEDEKEYDKDRQAEIEQLNIEFLRFTNERIYTDMTNVIEEIRAKVRELLNKNNL